MSRLKRLLRTISGMSLYTIYPFIFDYSSMTWGHVSMFYVFLDLFRYNIRIDPSTQKYGQIIPILLKMGQFSLKANVCQTSHLD